ncbi:MAG: hypothetical protein K2X66_16010 [Cyanobacteria bacterium]|nr:hypothetical protein [Cyanobacteriota bacterium]
MVLFFKRKLLGQSFAQKVFSVAKDGFFFFLLWEMILNAPSSAWAHDSLKSSKPVTPAPLSQKTSSDKSSGPKVSTPKPAPAPVAAAPLYHYREDEGILLKLTATDILEMERNKQYGQIYDEYTSQPLKKSLSRRDFLRMTHCLEQTVGEVITYKKNELAFDRKRVKNQNYDFTSVNMLRSGGNLREEMLFVLEGVDFKLNSIYWSSDRKDYLGCMRHIARTLTKPEKLKPQVPAVPSSTTSLPPNSATPPTTEVRAPDTNSLPGTLTKPMNPKPNGPKLPETVTMPAKVPGSVKTEPPVGTPVGKSAPNTPPVVNPSPSTSAPSPKAH